MRQILLFLLLSTTIISLSAQTKLNYNVEMSGAVSSSDVSPFWFSANRNGLSSIDKKWGYMQIGVAGSTLLKKNWNIEYGADIVGGKNLSSNIIIHQAYADFSWRWLRLSIGKKERFGELKNSTLSTGALIESGNAAPIPQLRIEVPEYHDFFGILDSN